MSTITTRVQIENLGYKRADRLREGEWVILGDRVATLADAEFFYGEHGADVKLRFKYLGVWDEYSESSEDETMIVSRTKGFPCINVTAGLVE